MYTFNTNHPSCMPSLLRRYAMWDMGFVEITYSAKNGQLFKLGPALIWSKKGCIIFVSS